MGGQVIEIRPVADRFLRLLEILGQWYEKGKVLIFVKGQGECDNLFRDLLKARPAPHSVAVRRHGRVHAHLQGLLRPNASVFQGGTMDHGARFGRGLICLSSLGCHRKTSCATALRQAAQCPALQAYRRPDGGVCFARWGVRAPLFIWQIGGT